jgi:cyclase
VLKKRLIGVITVKNGWAVQSLGYRKYLPLGKPEVLAENLDRWGVDEIFLQCIDRSAQQLGPDFSLLEKVGRKGLGTSLIYSGGVQTADQGVASIKLGADRVCIDALLHNAPEIVVELSRRLGAQALIAALPLAHEQGGLHWTDYRSGEAKPLDDRVLKLLQDKVVSEALVIDWKNEGHPQGFDFRLLEQFPQSGVPLIAFGGLSEAAQLQQALEFPQVVAVAVGNFLNYREHAVLCFKEQLAGLPLRMPI